MAKKMMRKVVPEKESPWADLGLLGMRLTLGGLLAGHGAQKLFGWFGGHGLTGTSQWMESMRMRPGRSWALLAGLSEFGGGLLTALGLLNPLGPVGAVAAMGMATAKVHWGKPVWVTSGGAELPLTNMAIAVSLMMCGPGKLSLDELAGTKLPRWVALPGVALAGAGVAVGLMVSMANEEQPQPEPASGQDGRERVAGAELQAGREAAHAL